MTSSKKSKASAFGEPTLKQTYKKHYQITKTY